MVQLRKVSPEFEGDSQHWNGADINNLVDLLQGNSLDKIPDSAIQALAWSKVTKSGSLLDDIEDVVLTGTGEGGNIPADGDVLAFEYSSLTWKNIALQAIANTWSDLQTFEDGNLALRNPADTFSAIVKAGAQVTSDKTFTFPVTSSDEIVVKDATQTLTGKTISGASNTISNIPASALSNITNTQIDAAAGIAKSKLASLAIVDADVSTHTTTKISTTSKSLLNTAIVYNDQNNSLGAYYQDISEIAAPANPSSGSRRIYVDNANHALCVKTSDGNTYTLEGASALPSRSTVGRFGAFHGNNASHIGEGLFRDFTLLGAEGVFGWVNAYGPTIKYTTGSSAGNYAGLRTTNQVASARMNPVLTAKFQTDSNASDRVKIGFTSSTTLTDAFNATLNNISGAMVGFDSGSANYSVITNNGGASQTNTTAGMPALTAANSATLVTLQITGQGSGLTWTIQNGSGTTTNTVSATLPAIDTTLYAYCAIQTNTGSGKGLTVEWFDMQLADRYLW